MKYKNPYPVSKNQIISKVVNINSKLLVIPKIGYITLWIQEIPKYLFYQQEKTN